MRASWTMLRNGSPLKNWPQRRSPKQTNCNGLPPEHPTPIRKLLARIDKNPVPKGYHGSRHQAYVNKVSGPKLEQRARVG